MATPPHRKTTSLSLTQIVRTVSPINVLSWLVTFIVDSTKLSSCGDSDEPQWSSTRVNPTRPLTPRGSGFSFMAACHLSALHKTFPSFLVSTVGPFRSFTLLDCVRIEPHIRYRIVHPHSTLDSTHTPRECHLHSRWLSRHDLRSG
jgi:hypothetical protein